MMSGPARDRRAPLFGGTSTSQGGGGSDVDLEAMERDNDHEIAALGDRVGLLKNITGNIQGEVHSQHRILDNMSMSMSGAGLSLGGAATKFKAVMVEPGGRRRLGMALGIAALLFVIYLWMR